MFYSFRMNLHILRYNFQYGNPRIGEDGAFVTALPVKLPFHLIPIFVFDSFKMNSLTFVL